MGNVVANFGKPVVISRDEQEESSRLLPLQAPTLRQSKIVRGSSTSVLHTKVFFRQVVPDEN